jgi:mitochondrial intermembrane space import and assembly protein 40
MATGPCGYEFREAFSCFHYSEAEPKGTDCYDAFKTMQECMSEYPTVYNQNANDDKEGLMMEELMGEEPDDEENVNEESSKQVVAVADNK